MAQACQTSGQNRKPAHDWNCYVAPTPAPLVTQSNSGTPPPGIAFTHQPQGYF